MRIRHILFHTLTNRPTKRTLILPIAILLMVASVIVSAQGYKREKLRQEFTSFPLEPLPEEYTTYYDEINRKGQLSLSTGKETRI